MRELLTIAALLVSAGLLAAWNTHGSGGLLLINTSGVLLTDVGGDLLQP